jgi:LacI family transcriptional regulator
MGDFDEASGHRAGREILDAGDRPDAVFAANDMMALGCLYAFAQGGLEVPRDVALAGFDDIPLARFVHPSLTTMRVSIAELGSNALKRLLAQIDTSEPAAIEHHVLVPELVVRQSSGGAEPSAAVKRGRRK